MALMGVRTIAGRLAAHLVLTITMSMALTLALTGWRAVAELLARTGMGWRDGEIAPWWLLGRSSRSKSTHLHGLAKTTSGTSGSW